MLHYSTLWIKSDLIEKKYALHIFTYKVREVGRESEGKKEEELFFTPLISELSHANIITLLDGAEERITEYVWRTSCFFFT